MKLNQFVALAIGLSGASIAMAAPITFDFTENRNYSKDGHEYIGSDGVSTVMATPYAEYGVPYLASSEGAGMYIYTCKSSSYCGYDNHQIDGAGPNEAAVLDFGAMVDLVSVTFSYVGWNDDFTLFADGEKIIDDADLNGGFWSMFDAGIATYTFDGTASGQEFAFLADHWSDDFKLYNITADYVSNVPEPASLSLLGLGLMALGSMRKKKA